MNRKLPILMFHHLEDSAEPISFPPSLFAGFISFLSGEGYRSITLGEAVDLIRSGKGFPDKSFAITFDDGFRSVFNMAFPVLSEYGCKATIFLTTGKNGPISGDSRLPQASGREMLSWNEIEEMTDAVFEPAAHTLTHPDLTRLDDEMIYDEAFQSKEIIEQRLGRKADLFAYPFGSFNSRVRGIISEIFRGACSVELGLAGTGSDLYGVERVDAFYLRSEYLFRIFSSRYFPLYLGLSGIPRGIRKMLKRGG